MVKLHIIVGRSVKQEMAGVSVRAPLIYEKKEARLARLLFDGMSSCIKSVTRCSTVSPVRSPGAAEVPAHVSRV